MFSSFSSTTEFFRWGPLPGYYLYNGLFLETIFEDAPRELGVTWSDNLLLFYGGRMVWINDYPSLIKDGEEVFRNFILPASVRDSLKKKWYAEVGKLRDLEREIEKQALNTLNDQEFVELLERFSAQLRRFWLCTIPPEFGNYSSDHLLLDKVREEVKAEEEVARIVQILGAPEQISFYQKEELELLAATDLQEHQQKYFWLKNSYAHTEIVSVEFFAGRKKHINPNLPEQIEQHHAEIKREKERIIKEYQLSKEIQDIAAALCRAVEWQDERKKEIFTFLHYLHLLAEEAARRTGISLTDLLNFSLLEIADLIHTGQTPPSLEDRRVAFGFAANPKMQLLNAKQTIDDWKLYAEDKAEDVEEIYGQTVSVGREKMVRGRVRIVLNPYQVGVFNEGDILIAPMTSPDYIFVMKKAAAVVTDTGGITSHAAVVSRELKIMCIVGTKVATRVFKDGDLVEVDALKGNIRRLL